MDIWKEKTVYIDWVYVLVVHCYIYLSVQTAQQFLLDEDAKYFCQKK